MYTRTVKQTVLAFIYRVGEKLQFIEKLLYEYIL